MAISQAELKKALELQAKALELEAQLTQYREENKIEFLELLPHQADAFALLHKGKKVIVVLGSNQIGKTVLGVNIVGSAALGYQPWDKKPTVWGKRPLKIRIICTDWENHAAGVIVPKMKEWLPRGSYTTKKNNTGVESFWFFPGTKTEAQIMTGKQDTQEHESWTGDLVWQDEPLSREKFVANKRGLVAKSGVYLMTLTEVDEPWVFDDLVLSDDLSIGAVTGIPMSANIHLTEDNIRNYGGVLTERERKVRVEGALAGLMGRIWPFKKDVHIIDSFKVPTDWPVIAEIDLHLNTEQAIGFYSKDKVGRMYVVDEVFEHLSPEEVADEIIRRKTANAWRLRKAWIDPLSKGDSKFMKNRKFNIEDSFTIIQRRLRAHGILLEVASKDKASGIRNVESMLVGVNGMPSLFYMKHCKRHIWEIMRWAIDPKTGKPKDEDDHTCETTYRATLTGFKYTPPDLFTKPLKSDSAGIV